MKNYFFTLILFFLSTFYANSNNHDIDKEGFLSKKLILPKIKFYKKTCFSSFCYTD
jgi:hypothetical protein